ncbi:YheC/D-like protein [Ureibacillus xyleni]|uniref:YheC/D-like protein n=1 Tax=Ureibacillus xyleni TaxID=614648 RepID=A0A285R839_9BACL|nr:YheC/YheD family protein [Ureibacillus xyleni]SOB90273.1 YheC/D-like protein [Ureibacillus xyleni]
MLIGVYNHEHPFKVLNQYRINFYVKEAAEQNVELCFFGIDDVDFDSKTIMGDIHEEGRWIKKKLPFPLLMINESNRSLDKLREPKKEMKLKQEIHTTSHLIDDKLTIYKKIQEANQFEYLLIPTIQLTRLSDFNEMINNYKKVILKPANESKGNGIIVVTQKQKSQYIFQEQTITTRHDLKATNKIILNVIRKGNYIIQPFIYSNTSDGKTFHIRVHLARNAKAQWIILKMIADIAEHGIDISNYKGVVTLEGEKFLIENYGKDTATKLYSKLENLAFQLTKHIDSFYPYSLNELAIDFGIDQNEMIWFFEGNTGPEIIAFQEKREQERAYHIISYSKMLAETLAKYPIEQRKGKHFKINTDNSKY